jgi:hypothetical protein
MTTNAVTAGSEYPTSIGGFYARTFAGSRDKYDRAIQEACVRTIAISILLASSALAADDAMLMVAGPKGETRSLKASDLQQLVSIKLQD